MLPLYIAENKETAIREVFQIKPQNKNKGLTDEDLALINKRSLFVVAVNGMLEQTLDLANKRKLNDFFNAIKTIKLPKSLAAKAKKIKIDPHTEIKTLTQLYNSIFNPNFKIYSMLFDIPSNSQILGHIAFESGIQAIKYPSRFTKANCLAIYPLNFNNSGSYININDKEAPESISDYRLDKTNYKNFT